MKINTGSLVFIIAANQNFSRVARLVNKIGSVVIFKNNVPRYLVICFQQAKEAREAADEDVLTVSKRLIRPNIRSWKNHLIDRQPGGNAPS